MAAKFTKTIICLANWRKESGRGVAGKELSGHKTGGWIRAVSATPGGGLLEEACRLQDGMEPRPLDVISVPMIEARPRGYHVENHIVDDTCCWTKVGKADWSDLQAALDTVGGPLWDNSSSSFNGVNDRIAETAANGLSNSLRLISVNDLTIVVRAEGSEIGKAKRKVRGRFTFNGTSHLLAVTDCACEDKYLTGLDGAFPIGRAVLCVSLREPYRGYVYKLIASVIPEAA